MIVTKVFIKLHFCLHQVGLGGRRLCTSDTRLVGVHSCLSRGPIPRARIHVSRVRSTGLSRVLLKGVLGTMRSGLDRTRFSIRRLTRGIGVSHSALAHGLGTVAKLAPLRCVHHIGVRRTYHVLGSPRAAIGRITLTLNCCGQGCFASYFGRRCKVAPDRFRGRRRGKSASRSGRKWG